MPHSVPSKDMESSNTMMVDNEVENGDTQSTDNTDQTGGPAPDDIDQDMAVTEPGVESQESHGEKADAEDDYVLVKAEDIDVEEPMIKAESKPEVRLEDLFADMDSDDELLSATKKDDSFPSSPEQPSSPPVRNSDPSGAADDNVMQAFYQRLFPWRHLFQWLNHSPNPTTDFMHREIAFTLQNDAYLRYQSFRSADLLRKEVLKLNPSRFEIGPVYSANPRDRKQLPSSSAFKPISKELCFDIDLTDYDDIRTCCDQANICIKCWQFITMAVKVLDVALREDFGFKHILWVYSGRRGAHAWVCDKKARQMDDQKRRAIASYLEVIKGGNQGGKRVQVQRPLHPHVARSLDILKVYFQNEVLKDQDPWETDRAYDRLLQLLPDRTLNDALRKKWSSVTARSSTQKWADIDAVAKTGASKNLDPKALLEAKQDIVLEYSYPRLDIEVSKHLNHLLKSPFVVHPGTGRVCVPIDTRHVEDFDPLGVPTVLGLLGEIDAWKSDGGEGKSVQDWEKTSLKPYIEYFRSFVANLLKDEDTVKVKRERDAGEAMEF